MKNRSRCLSAGVLLAVALLAWAAGPKEQPKVKLSDEEKKILDLTNEARTKEKKPPLQPNAVLCEVARAHAANMAKQSKASHVLDGKNPAQRVLAAGYDYASVAENIADGQGEWTPEEVMQAWIDSKIHKDNIVQEKFQEIGIGIAKNEKGEFYLAQVFGTPKKKR